jgi:hypothetical protein
MSAEPQAECLRRVERQIAGLITLITASCHGKLNATIALPEGAPFLPPPQAITTY